MFKKSNKEPPLDAFASVPMMLEGSALKQSSDQGHWHNQFHDHVVMRIDETIFSISSTKRNYMVKDHPPNQVTQLKFAWT